MEKLSNNPKQSKLELSNMAMHHSARCMAKTRKAGSCQSPAMPNGRCRMHGGKSTGAPKGNKNAQKHGFYSRESKAMMKKVKAILNDANKLLGSI